MQYEIRNGVSAANDVAIDFIINQVSLWSISPVWYACFTNHTSKMPPRAPLPRSLHLPTHTTTKPTWKAPKPHLAHLHLDTPPPFQNSFQPPQTPQLPPRRQPAYNPGGFGLGGSFKFDDPKGKQKAVEDVEANEGDAEACYVVCPYFRRSQGLH
jgi:hypothetical protein